MDVYVTEQSPEVMKLLQESTQQISEGKSEQGVATLMKLFQEGKVFIQ